MVNFFRKARVEKVHIEGLARTKDDIIKDAVSDLFSASDFQDVLVKAHKVINISKLRGEKHKLMCCFAGTS